ncbi:MAG: Na+/H+ antiporter subunit B [Planctomycetota bacterium]
MKSLVLQTATRILLPVMLIVSLYALIRGHNEPGGGFIGGLLAASGFALYALAFDVESARRVLRTSPGTLIGGGLIVAVLSGVPALFDGGVYMEGRWTSLDIPGMSSPFKLGTPLLFDIGVYLVVIGIVLLMTFALEDRHDGAAARN